MRRSFAGGAAAGGAAAGTAYGSGPGNLADARSCSGAVSAAAVYTVLPLPEVQSPVQDRPPPTPPPLSMSTFRYGLPRSSSHAATYTRYRRLSYLVLCKQVFFQSMLFSKGRDM